MDERSQAYPLLIALMLSAVAAFTAGWLLARGHGQELEPGLGFWVYALLCGVSAAAWSVPWARAARQHSPRKARSVYWKRTARGMTLRLVSGSCLGIGTLRLLWNPVALRTLPDGWAILFFIACLGLGVHLWHLGGGVLNDAPRVARKALRKATSFSRASAKKHKTRREQPR
jgi:Na+/proline symporter